MLKTSIIMHRKNPGYEVKAILSLSGSGFTPENETRKADDNAQLEELKKKLEHLLPGSLKAKYNLSSDKLVVTLVCKDAPEAQRHLRKMEDHVKNAATQLNIK